MTALMRVLMIAHNGVLLSNQRKLEALVRQARHQGMALDLTLLTPPENLESAGMVAIERTRADDFTILVGKPWFSLVGGQRYLQVYPEMKRVLQRVQPDLIDLWEEPWSLVSWHTVRLRDRLLPGVPIVHETEQNVFKRFPFPFGLFERQVLAGTRHFIARNDEARAVIEQKGFRGPIDVLPNGLDEASFTPRHPGAVRQRLGLKGFVVGYVGRLEEEKGLRELQAATAAMDGTQLLCVGVGSLKSFLSTSPNTHVAGPVNQQELPDHYAAMDVLVLPSRTTPTWKEQFGRTLIEAWAAGLPVVGSSSGAIPGVIGEAGIVFPETDVAALTRALTTLRDDEGRRRDLAAAGQSRLRAHYTWDVIAGRMVQIYKECLTP